MSWIKNKCADIDLYILLDFTSITVFFFVVVVVAKTIPSKSGEAAVIKRPLLSFIVVQTNNLVSS